MKIKSKNQGYSFLNELSSIITASPIPKRAPMITVIMAGQVCSKFNLLFLYSVAAPLMLWVNTPSLVVPFATDGLRPIISVQRDKVMTDPFPASVLMMPASTPPKAKKTKSSIHTNLHGLTQFY